MKKNGCITKECIAKFTQLWTIPCLLLIPTVAQAVTVSLVQDVSTANATYRDVGYSVTTDDMATYLDNEGSGTIVSNYVGNVTWGWGYSDWVNQAALKFALPITSSILSTAKLHLPVIEIRGSAWLTVTLTDDNAWQQTNVSMTSTYPSLVNAKTLISTQSVSASGDVAFSLDTTNLRPKITSSGMTTVTFILTGNTATDNYFNFVADDDASSDQAYLVLTFKPQVQSVSAPSNGTYKIGDALDFTVTFDSTVVVTGTPRIPVTLSTGGTVYASYVSGTNSKNLVFRHTVSSGELDADGISIGSSISLNGGAIKSANNDDAELNLYSVASTANVLVDGVVPSISSVPPPSDGTYIIGQNLDYTVSFGEAVNVVTSGGTPYLTLTLGSTAVHAAYVSGTGSTALTFRYTAVSGDADADGVTLASNVTLNGGTIKDAAGNDAALTFTGSTATGVLVDAVAPAITGVTGPSAGTYASGDTLWFTATFSEDVTVSGTPFIGLTIGNTARQALYVSGSGTGTLKFGYEVASGDEDADGIDVDASVSLNEGSIADDAGNAALLDLGTFETEGVFVNNQPTVMVQKNFDPAGYSLCSVSSSGLFHVELPAGVHHAEIILLDAAGRRLAAKSLDVSSSSMDVQLQSSARWNLAILRVDGHVKASARGGVPLR